MINTQMSIFEIAQEERCKSVSPIFEIGQNVFVLSLDVVMRGVVERMWLCGKDSEAPYFGYSISGSGRGVVWDTDVNKTLFDNKADANRKAASIGQRIVEFAPSEIEAHDLCGFEYYRECDDYRLTSCAAKVGDIQLYEHDYYCYHFLRTFPTQKERNKAYKKLLNKIFEESDRSGAVELAEPEFEVLYRVTDTLYASREYAERHNNEYACLMEGTEDAEDV